MRFSLIAASAGLLAVGASAQIVPTLNGISSDRPSGGSTPRSNDTYRQASEDGSSENSVGAGAVDMVWIARYTVFGGNSTITAVNSAFGTPAFPGSSGVGVGSPVTVYVWQDIGNDGTMDNNSLLGTGTDFIGVLPDTDAFQKIAVNAVVPGGDGAGFFVGVKVTVPANSFPAPLDETDPDAAPLLAGFANPGTWNPNNLAANAFPPADIRPFAINGAWLLRANAIPEPTSLALLALGLAALRRR
jgi:PEP-CTERM motif